MRPVYAYAGDTFFTRSSSLLGRLIRWAETDPSEEPTWANHTGVVVEDGWIGPRAPQAIVVEALWHVRRGPLDTSNGAQVRVFGPVEMLIQTEVDIFRNAANEFVGRSYGWWKLLFHLADRALFRGRKVLSHALRLDARPICSYLAAKVGDRVGLYYGCDPEVATPDEMLDYCMAHPDEWRQR